MRSRRLAAGLCLGLGLPLVAAALAACHPPRSRYDWRTPYPQVPCSSDADCSGGGQCVMELGASQGTCSGASVGEGGAPSDSPMGPGHAPGHAPGHGPDGGRGPLHPPPIVTPQPGDIQI